MSHSDSESNQKTETTTISDSYNKTATVTNTLSDVGNTEFNLNVNSPSGNLPEIGNIMPIAAGVFLLGAMFLMRK